MKLSKLLKVIGGGALTQDPEITSISCDSRRVQKGSLFIAVDGNKEKGSSFIDEAIARGAACVIAPDEILNKKIPIIPFSDTRSAVALLACEFFGHPSKKFKCVGVTGTNGKTTVTYLIESILKCSGISSGVIGTIGYEFNGKIKDAPNTTPSAIELQSLMKDWLALACDYCIMEVSSHGLEQKRTLGIDFQSAIFTNLTHDHLDYHGTLENYFLAKASLFSSLDEKASAIVNLDSPFALRLKDLTRAKFISYGIDTDADIKARDLVLGLKGSSFIVENNDLAFEIKTSFIGRHNVLNLLAGIAFGLVSGIDLAQIKKGIEKFSGAKGRLERVENSRGLNIFIDYAHTPDALENVLGILRQFSNKLTVVFGCGGERDHFKRPLMGAVAEKYADQVIITADNPRSEEPEDIAKEISLGIKVKPYRIILDRREAIFFALKDAHVDEIILIAGKGHEDYQIFKDRKIEFNDRKVTEEILKNVHG